MFSPKPHILYVESHDDTRFLIQLMLEKQDFRVTASVDDEHFLNQIKHLKQSDYDLILLEPTANGRTGAMLCETIRAFDQETPILFFSSRARPDDRAAALRAGAQSYLIKPDDLSRLTDEAARLICESKPRFARN